jgi:hypothetical protein
VTRPRPPVLRRSVVVATWAAVAVASVAAVRAAVDRAVRPPTRCASEWVRRGPLPAPVPETRSDR